MDLDKIINELSQNERKVLLILQKLNGEAPPQTIFDTGDFTQQVEIMHAAAWLQSKKLVTIKEDITTVYLLAKEGKHYQDQGLPEKRAIQHIIKQNTNVPLTDLKKTTPDDLHQWLVDHKITHIAWMSANKIFETENAWYAWKMENRGWKNIAFLADGKDSNDFTLVKKINVGPRWAFIYKI